MPLRALACAATLPPLPVHLSWRIDASSSAQRPVIDSLLAHLGANPKASKKSMTWERKFMFVG